MKKLKQILIIAMLAFIPLFLVNGAFAGDKSGKEEEVYPVSTRKIAKPEYELVGLGLFQGRDPFSYAIRGLTNSTYSHIGAILCKAGEDKTNVKNWVCFESTGDANKILEEGKLPGVGLSPWTEVLTNYQGNVYTRIFESGTLPSKEKITDFVEKYDGTSYEVDLSELISSINKENTKPKLKKLFCSELVAQMFIETGIFDIDNLSNSQKISNNYTPRDLSSEGKKILPLMKGIVLSKEIMVKKTHDPLAFVTDIKGFVRKSNEDTSGMLEYIEKNMKKEAAKKCINCIIV